MRLLVLFRWLLVGSLLAAGSIALLAANADPHPVVGPGASRDEVIKAYGWPNGQSQSGTKEILSYNQGDVILENGRVERVNFSPDVPWQKPRPRPGPATASTRKVPEAPVDYWVSDFNEALQQAGQRHVRILALFTGSDWSPASRAFHDEVEDHPDFVNAFAGDFVFLKLDFPRGSPVPATISAENAELRDRYQVTTYPTLLILSATGELLAPVDLNKSVAGSSFRQRVIDAVNEARATLPLPDNETTAPAKAAPATAANPPPVNAAPAPATASSAATSSRPLDIGNPAAMARSPAQPIMKRAGVLIALAILLAAGIIAGLWRLLWGRPKEKSEAEMLEYAERIDAAAGGLPSQSDMSAWSKEKLVAVAAGLTAYDDYAVQIRTTGVDVDLELRKRGDTKPRVLVYCAPGSIGVVNAKRVRELFGTMTAEGVDNGWFISPAGFSAEAREYAAAHRIILVAADGIHNLMREVPPVSLPALLARS